MIFKQTMSLVDDSSFFDFSHDTICTERRYVAAYVNTCYSTEKKDRDIREVNHLFIFCARPNRYNLFG